MNQNKREILKNEEETKKCICCRDYAKKKDMEFSIWGDGYICEKCLDWGNYVLAVDVDDFIPEQELYYTTDTWEYYVNKTKLYYDEETNLYYKDAPKKNKEIQK
jgi:hypothetical protein